MKEGAGVALLLCVEKRGCFPGQSGSRRRTGVREQCPSGRYSRGRDLCGALALDPQPPSWQSEKNLHI